MQPSDALDLAISLLRQHGLLAKGWKIKFDRARKRFGYCDERKKEISLSKPLVILNDRPQIEDTILHEIAHALAGYEAGHGDKWKAIARSIGCNAERGYDDTTVVQPLPKYQAVCKFCYRVVSRETMPKKPISCGRCYRQCYNPKYQLIFKPTDPQRVYFAVSLRTRAEETFHGTISVRPNQIEGRVRVDGRFVPATLKIIGTDETPCLVLPKDDLPNTFKHRYPRSTTQDALLRFAPRCEASFKNLILSLHAKTD